MGAPLSLHPTDQTLQAYGLGSLDEDASASVDSHLAECSACRQRAAEMSGDSFLGRLQEAHQAKGQGGPPSSAVPRGRGSSSIGDDGPPRELLDHPDYQVVRELGRGGMGVVYLAENTLMGRMEVLKVVGSHLVKRQGVLDRFLREIRSAAKLHHPNIVGAYAAMRLGDCVVLAMEYVEGEDLAQLVKSRGALPVTNACYFTYQAALGLQHAHERGMVHRDIKPANLILAREGKKAIVKVLDFGLAKATSEGQLDAGLTHEGQMLGTPDFIAPEQIVDAQRADIRADIYSLGCTLYYLLNGGAPFRATSLYQLLQAHHSTDAPALNMVRPEVPPELAALVAKMMAKDPSRRFQTPGEVAQALTRFFKPGAPPLSGSNAEVPRAAPPAPTPPPSLAATQPATDVGPARAPAPTKRPAKPGPEGVAWESLIEFKQTEPPTLAIRPKPAEPEPAEAAGKPPRSWWPIIAAASAAGSIALGIIITIYSRDGSKTSLNIPTGRAVKGSVDEIHFDHTPPVRTQADARPSEATTPDVAAVPAPPPGIVKDIPPPEIRGGPVESRADTPGYAALFNGKDIASWWAWGKQGQMDAREMQQVWSVRNGVLVGSGALSHLFSPRGDYTDFRVRAEVKISDRGNSGLYFRAAKGPGYPQGYEAQINATHRDPARTGSLYKPGAGPVRAMARSLVAPNTWFVLEAEAVGDHIRVWVDGTLTADWNEPNRTYTRGHFAIQVHDPETTVQVRKLEVMDLSPSARPPASVADAAKGAFRPLFNGRDLDGWRPNHEPDRWSVRGASIVTTGSGDWRNQSFLLSTQDFSDFLLRFEIALNKGTDSGVVLRADPAAMPTCLQVNFTNMENPRFPTGSLRWKKVDTDYMFPFGQPEGGPYGSWSRVEIEARGETVSVTYNGREIFRQDLSKLAGRPEAMPGLMRRAGRIGFQSHTGTARFRNIEIRELDPPTRPAASVADAAELSKKLAQEIRSVPTRPGVLKLEMGPPDGFSPNLTPDDTEGWRAGDPAHISMTGRGLTVKAGTSGGNYFLTRRTDYKKCTLRVVLSATEGTEAYLVLRAAEGPDGWRGITSRIVDEGGKIRAGWQSMDFATPERGGDPKADFKPGADFTVRFSIDETNKATVLSQLKTSTVAHDGPRHLDPSGAAGLFVRKGSVTVKSLRVDE